jgi:hypothetical protein
MDRLDRFSSFHGCVTGTNGGRARRCDLGSLSPSNHILMSAMTARAQPIQLSPSATHHHQSTPKTSPGVCKSAEVLAKVENAAS